MAPSLSRAMRLLESGQVAGAAAAFEPLGAATREGTIARFRRAECLSRLGRHDEAVAAAREALADAAGSAPASLWLAQTLAEAGRLEEAAAVELPDTEAESLAPLRAGYAALAQLGAGAATGRAEAARALLDTRHPPLYSLALRLAETQRLSAEPRHPDLPSRWYALECRMEREELGQAEHDPEPVLGERVWRARPADIPRAGGPAKLIAGVSAAIPRRWTPARAAAWLRLHVGCREHDALIAALRAAPKTPESVDESELEVLLALGRLDAAETLAERLAAEAGSEAAGELAVDRARLAQLRGRPARAADFPGADDARKRLVPLVTWLDMAAHLLEGDEIAARAPADRLADPSHREFVEAALRRWSDPGRAG